MRKSLIYCQLILLTLFAVSCAKDEVPKSGAGKEEKKLDTSFLRLGAIGTKNVSVTPVTDTTRIHVLRDDQKITIINSTGEIKIANFDYSKLKKDHIIVGNSVDKYLFKYTRVDAQASAASIKVEQASLNDIDDKMKMDVEFTPEIQYRASEGRSYTESIGALAGSSMVAANAQKSSSDKVNPSKKNILRFDNYEIIDTNKINIAAFNLIAGNKMTLEKGSDVKATIDSGYIELIPTFNGSYDFESINDVELMATFDTYLKYRFEVTVETNEATMGMISFPLFKTISIPVRAMAGIVPVYVDLNIAFPAGMKIYSKSKGKVTFTIENEYALNAQIGFNSDAGTHQDGHYDYIVKDQKIDIKSGNANYAFEVFFEPKIKTKMYRVLGPYAYVNSNVQADIKLPLDKNRDDLFLNFSGGIGLHVEDPIFGRKLYSLKSDSLYNFSKGWDILGPNLGGQAVHGLQTMGDVGVEVEELSDDGSVAIQLRPSNASLLTQVIVTKMPAFGKIVLGDNFKMDGIAYYYPPQVIEGTDSFQIVTIERGVKSAPTRVTLNLSSKAKQQASGPKNVLSRYESPRSSTSKAHTVGNMIVSARDGVWDFMEDPIIRKEKRNLLRRNERRQLYSSTVIAEFLVNDKLLENEDIWDKTFMELRLKQTKGNDYFLELIPTSIGTKVLDGRHGHENAIYFIKKVKELITNVNKHIKTSMKVDIKNYKGSSLEDTMSKLHEFFDFDKGIITPPVDFATIVRTLGCLDELSVQPRMSYTLLDRDEWLDYLELESLKVNKCSKPALNSSINMIYDSNLDKV